jgi:RHS repeat-associated protein
VQYQYDLVGNRQVVRDNGVPLTYTVNSMNQYTTVGGEPLSYDANGNLTIMPGLSLQYDSWNRLISAATESNLVLFAYDGRHRCVKRVEIQNGLGRTTIMIWGHEPSQGWGLLEERGANGELLARHVHGPSVDDLVLSELGGAVYYYHHDHLNSTIAVTDESGNVVEQYRYDAYGQPYFYGPDGTPRRESLVGLRFLFTGREWLSSLALYDYRHRLYSPSLGRFLQMDPLGFAAGVVNVYGYVRPLVDTDPLGLLTWSQVRRFAAGVLVGAVTAAVIAVAAPVVASVGAAALVAAGVSAGAATTMATGIVSASLLIAGGVSAWFTGQRLYKAIGEGDWDTVAYEAGILAGAGFVGVVGGGRALAEMKEPSSSPRTWNLMKLLANEWKKKYDPRLGPPDLEYFATAPAPLTGGVATAFIAAEAGYSWNLEKEDKVCLDYE